MFADETVFLKLLWDPDDIDGDQVKPTAFRKSELSGKPTDFVSVDRKDIAERAVMESLAELQQNRAVGRDDMTRDIGYIGTFTYGELRSHRLDDEERTFIFDVQPHPLDENPAHCGIHNVGGQTGRSKIDMMRGLLASMAALILTFDDV